MNYYTIKYNQSLVISDIESKILDWKIRNLVTYMDAITYINDNMITFIIEINDKIYNFMIYQKSSNQSANQSSNQSANQSSNWYLNFTDDLDQLNPMHFKILDAVDMINEKYAETEQNDIIYLMDLVEKTIDEYDFDDESESESETESESESNMANADSDTEAQVNSPKSTGQNLTGQKSTGQNLTGQKSKPLVDTEYADLMAKLDEFDDLNAFDTTNNLESSNIRSNIRTNLVPTYNKFDPFHDSFLEEYEDPFDDSDNSSSKSETSKMIKQNMDVVRPNDLTDLTDLTDYDFKNMEKAIEEYNASDNHMDMLESQVSNAIETIELSKNNVLSVDNLSTPIVSYSAPKTEHVELNIDDDAYFNKLTNQSNDLEYVESNNLIGNSDPDNDNVSSISEDMDDDFAMFARDMANSDEEIKINYTKLKTKAFDTISNIRSKSSGELEVKLFRPEDSVMIIINELKQFADHTDIQLEFPDSNIYDFRIIKHSDKFNTNIVLNVRINTMEYPSAPPTVNIIKPLMTYNLNYLINTMDYFKLEYWNPTNSMLNMTLKLFELIEKYGTVAEGRESYSELSNYLTSLSILSKTRPTFSNSVMNSLDDLQIPFVKCSTTFETQSVNNTWKSGTGYGTAGSKEWDIKKYLESDKYKLEQLSKLINDIGSNIKTYIGDNSTNPYLIDDIINSCLMEYIMSNITDNFDLGLLESKTVYIESLINICEDLYQIDPSLFVPYYSKIKANIDNIRMINQLVQSNKITIRLAQLYEKLSTDSDKLDVLTKAIDQIKNNTDTDTSSKEHYIEQMKPLQFSMTKGLKNVCFENKKMLSTIRLAREISILSKSLPMDYVSSIYVRVDETNMQNIKALIIPADETPYADGCFIFDIFIPETYPKVPPTVKIITTGNGSVRFNPNLYACGKVCLSLLGTWRGSASESWNENSTLLQVLISIQSLIFIDKPYFNEPGYEKSYNTPDGKKRSDEYNRNVQYNTVCWAMVDMLKNPPAEFASVIKTHFKLKKSCIMKRVNEWINDSKYVDTSKFSAKYNELCNLLIDLA